MIVTAVQVGSRYPINRMRIRACVERVLLAQGVSDAEVSVSVVGNRQMVKLNEGLMKHQGTTDVLSFPQVDPEQVDKNFPTRIEVEGVERPRHLGDIVVCFPEVIREAAKLGRMVDDQICFLVEHGLMHLLGFHHD